MIVGFVILFVGTSIGSAITGNPCNNPNAMDRGWFYVGGNGPGNYSHIQDAINNASNGDTVYVYAYSSPYNEQVIINKKINLIGENKETTAITTYNSGTGVNISADGVKIDGFSVHDCGNWYNYYPGIYVNHSNASILTNLVLYYNDNNLVLVSTQNTIINNVELLSSYGQGIILRFSSHNVMEHDVFSGGSYLYLDHSPDNFCNNTVFDGSNGIYAKCSNHTFIGRCLFAGQSGVQFDHSNNSTIINCLFQSKISAITLLYSNNNFVFHNNITSTYDKGIDFYYSNNNIIQQNSLWSNFYGVYLSYSHDNTFVCNSFFQNAYYHMMMDQYCIENVVHHNNFYKWYNQGDVSSSVGNTFDDGYPSGGNFWERNQGTDEYHGPNQDIPGPDGLCDFPYIISGGVDWYPLMHPFETYFILDIELQNTSVNEGTTFLVTVHTQGGTFAQNATVEFNNEIKLTDENGTAHFTAPQVNENTTYTITADKVGYTGDTKPIIVENIPQENNITALFWGTITNATTQGNTTTFNAEKLRVITFSPFSLNKYTSGEQFTIAKDYKGFIGKRHIIAFCTMFT